MYIGWIPEFCFGFKTTEVAVLSLVFHLPAVVTWNKVVYEWSSMIVNGQVMWVHSALWGQRSECG